MLEQKLASMSGTLGLRQHVLLLETTPEFPIGIARTHSVMQRANHRSHAASITTGLAPMISSSSFEE